MALVGPAAEALRGLLRPQPVLQALVDAAAAGEPVRARGEMIDGQGRTVALALRGQLLPRRTDSFLVWLATVEPGERARPLTGLSRECFYELAVDIDCRLRLTWADPRLAELTGHTREELDASGGFFALVPGRIAAACHRTRASRQRSWRAKC